jgi:peptide/nickel transport system permease protein
MTMRIAVQQQALQGLRPILRYPSGTAGMVIVVAFTAIAVIGPLIAPHSPFEVVYRPDHSVLRLSPPTWRALFGTTNQGMDVFSQLVWGTRVAMLVGLLSAIGSVILGTIVGLAAGYFGGWIDES